MALLDIIQDAALELGLRNITSVVGSSDLLVRQLLALANEEVSHLLDDYLWPQLQKQVTITLVSGQDNYSLPADFDQSIFTTQWDSTNHWQLLGPVTPEEWQHYKAGISQLTPRKVFRIKGAQDRKLYIHPTPDTGDDGNTLVFEYISRQAIRPAGWSSGASYPVGTFSFYDGNVYYTAGGGTAGATPPTHTTGTVTDGEVLWAYRDGEYVEFVKDTDVCLLPERVVKLGVKWRFRSAKGLDIEQAQDEYRRALSSAHAKLGGAREISITGARSSMHLGDWRNVPDTGFGS